MPMPVSATLNRSFSKLAVCPGSLSTLTIISPACVNFMALDSRFSSTCLIRSASARTMACTLSSMSGMTSRPFLAALIMMVSSASSTASATPNFTGFSTSLPLSMRVMSRILLMRRSSDSALVCTTSASSACSCVRSVVSSSWLIPRIPLSGVRISWLMFARNWLLASLAALALLSSTSACITRRVSVMSCSSITAPTMFPLMSRRGLAFSRTNSSLPALVQMLRP
mmetsp:Transcript_15422/g.43139  ORF Transcript_15422/g.43139 Transcript_15422/m.43139 type:complete len:226 (-) Transcript_15422:1574-2251(-)